MVTLHAADYGAWLSCPVEEAPRFFRQWQDPLQGHASPLPPPQTGSLF